MHSKRVKQSISTDQQLLLVIVATCVFFLISFSRISLALESDRQQPIQIEAQQAEFNPETGIAVYTGNVKMEQGSLKVSADQITIYQNDQKEVDKVVATAKSILVHMQQQPKPDEPLVHAYAQKIEYLSAEQEMLLQKNARLENGQDQFAGDKIRYHLQTRHIKAWGAEESDDSEAAVKGPQVKIILYPKTQTNAQDKGQ
ncbi:lipopolysaccharide export system protein LptA [Oceanospirillum multiglobuliferum]|uniref:Lipopolysaccharide export system protein LptA n=1 Tax=Oceanospirillum multiglobuliferum TaxID=64969 RepID=A0A1T4KU99_9GAMM|nr:lipopolysaccharide transport periplasmic protein LptA [Oceanospirillum multiglobuliferum]OPX54944.1 lipopolysaccharide transport periplasmic protein LptA [Oceanospirillum multiglobuliferum]SJZ45928.1 lipopolysaccharide export system protein LptA [Oceanospirillum multiglobuliferum]